MNHPRNPMVPCIQPLYRNEGGYSITPSLAIGLVNLLCGGESFTDMESFGMVESIRNVKGKSAIERRYYLSSLPLDAQRFGHAVRSHWGVENSLHWSLDVTFREDDSRARTRNAAQNLATLRRFALNLIEKDRSRKASIRSKRFIASIDQEFLVHLTGI